MSCSNTANFVVSLFTTAATPALLSAVVVKFPLDAGESTSAVYGTNPSPAPEPPTLSPSKLTSQPVKSLNVLLAISVCVPSKTIKSAVL